MSRPESRIPGAHTPGVSVIIPTHQRTELLRHTLRSMHQQDMPHDAFEVIVVDDGSQPPVAEQVADLCAGPVSISVVRNEVPQQAGPARNRGAAHARFDVLLFLDAECYADVHLVSAHAAAQRERAAAYASYTAAREVTPEQWPVLVGEQWDLQDAAAVFAAIAQIPALDDPLATELVAPHPSDWVFFWTSAASVPTAAFYDIGGFSADFDVKGDEDLELGYRMAFAGFPTLFLPEGRCFHQPHSRSRHMEIQRDRRNDHVMLRHHSTLEMEVVTAFGLAAGRRAYDDIAVHASRLEAVTSDCSKLSNASAVVEQLRAAESCLLLGAPNGWPRELPFPTQVVFPGPLPDSTLPHLPLLGARLPHDRGTFGLGVITDYWRWFPLPTRCRVLGEMLRICDRVILLSDVSTAPLGSPPKGLANLLAMHDRPYWEFTVPVPRELHQFEFRPLDEGEGVRSFEVVPREWPSAPLATVLH